MKKFTLVLAALLVSAMTVGAAAQTAATSQEVKSCCKKATKKELKVATIDTTKTIKGNKCGKCASAQATGKCCAKSTGKCCKSDSIKKASCKKSATCKKASTCTSK